VHCVKPSTRSQTKISLFAIQWKKLGQEKHVRHASFLCVLLAQVPVSEAWLSPSHPSSDLRWRHHFSRWRAYGPVKRWLDYSCLADLWLLKSKCMLWSADLCISNTHKRYFNLYELRISPCQHWLFWVILHLQNYVKLVCNSTLPNALDRVCGSRNIVSLI